MHFPRGPRNLAEKPCIKIPFLAKVREFGTKLENWDFQSLAKKKVTLLSV